MESHAPTLSKPAKIDVIAENIPEEIKILKRWVTWDWIWSLKNEKWTKPPLQANKMLASSTDAKTWTTFEIALLLGRSRAGVGFMLGEDVGIVGIDLDKCRNPETGEIKPLQASIIKQLATYAEVSPSGTGVKLLCRGKLPEKCRKADHEIGIEIYCDKRYFTITGVTLADAPKTINQCQMQLDELIGRFMLSSQADLPRPEMLSEEDEIELAKSALQSIDSSLADGYTDWLMIGMALHAISPYLLPDWDRWSGASSKYAPGECARKWSSFDGQGVGPGTLYHFAKMRGWQPPRGWKKTKAAPRASLIVENYHREITIAKDGTERLTRIAHTQKQIVAAIFELFDNWPKRIANQLFICNGSKVEFLPKPANLFSWMRESRELIWGAGDDLVTKEELHISLCRSAQEYSDVQEHPHFPPIEGIYYTCKQPTKGDGTYLKKMLDLFSPATPEDRQLILAAIATTFWGGPPGQRPAFLISAAPGAGQGTGKSTLASMISNLTGGFIDISTGMEAEDIKKRFLSGGDTGKRVVCLDNVKRTKFSDQGIEALLTSPSISGHRMFFGSFSRPNLLTWFITMNGPSLSRDLAQRTVNIVLKRPKHTGNWFEEANNFVKQHQLEIVADIAGFFQRPQTEMDYSRKGLWEREVLSRVENAHDVARVISNRESANDDDQQQANAIEEYIGEKLKVEAGYEHPMKVHIKNGRMQDWVADAIGEDARGNGARHIQSILTRFENLGLFFFLSKNPSRRILGRGWVFSSADEEMETRYDLESRVV